VATHLENLQKSANLGVIREKSEKKEVRKKSGKVCSCIWSVTASNIHLDTKCAKKELFTR